MREKLIELLTHDDCPIFMVFGDNMEGLADYLIANGVVISNLETTTFATDNKVGHWITKNGCTFCSECMTCGSPQLKVCPVCETRMVGDELSPAAYNVSATEPKWIPVTERLPEPETEVLVLAERKGYSVVTKSVTTHHAVTTAMYEDGTKNTEDSNWWWETDGFEYDEELDAYIIPEGWWEYKHYNGDEDHNHGIDDAVTHWMPLPEPPKGE